MQFSTMSTIFSAYYIFTTSECILLSNNCKYIYTYTHHKFQFCNFFFQSTLMFVISESLKKNLLNKYVLQLFFKLTEQSHFIANLYLFIPKTNSIFY